MLLNGAPVMREMLNRILTQVCILGERAIVWTVSPGQQWYVAAVLNLVGISVGYPRGCREPTRAHQVLQSARTGSPSAGAPVCHQLRGQHTLLPLLLANRSAA